MAVLRYFHQAPKTTTSTTVVDNTAVQTITAALNTKADKVVGRGFSQNNYSTIEKTKLSGIEEGAEVNVQSDWNEIDPESDAFILNKPDIPILDQSGQIPARYLPSYVDDVLEYSSTSAFPNPGETGKIYVDTSTDLTYRWSGSTYVEISKSILTGVKGDAESTYRVGNVNLTATNIGLGNVANIDQSKAIKSITRSGTTFTYTCLDGTTGTFTQQDNDTTYSAGSGLSLSGTTFSLALTKALVTAALGYTPPTSDTNTWRTVQCNGTSIGSNTLNLKAGTNVTLSNSNGTITISSTDTNTWPSKVSQLTNDSGYITGITKAMVTNALGYTPPATDTNTTYNFAGVSFTSGKSNTGEHNANNITSNGVWYYTSNGPATSLGASTIDGALYSQAYSTSWVGQIAQDYRNGRLFVRGKNNNTWQPWLRVALTGEAQPASDVYSWAKASTKPSYSWSEITSKPTIPSGTQIVQSGTNPDNFGNMNTIFTVGDDMYINVLKSSSGVAYQWRFSADGYMYVRKRRDWVNWNSWVTMQNLQPI